jgi:hypothetical protein
MTPWLVDPMDRNSTTRPRSPRQKTEAARKHVGWFMDQVARLLMLPMIVIVSVCWLVAAVLATIWHAAAGPVREDLEK